MEKVSHMDVKFMWGNSNYDYVFSEAAGNSGGILCIWEESFFKKDYVTISDSFVAIYGTWIPSKTKLLVVSIYAPQQPSLRRVLWEYLLILLGRWNGEAILMGDYNEVRTNVERRGTCFNVNNASFFNQFISSSGLVDIKMEGYTFTWSHPSAEKMSKLDRFLVSDGILTIFPSISALCLDRHLSDHRPILLCEVKVDFGPIPFRFYHSWFKLVGFDDMVEQTWRALAYSDNNKMIRFKKKLQELKKVIRLWVNDKKIQSAGSKNSIVSELRDIDKRLDQYGPIDSLIFRRQDLMSNLNDLKEMEDMDFVQKAKVRWAIEGDENSKLLDSFDLVYWIRGIHDFAKASLLVNGSPSDEFHIHRGLKQGDPLSPFLFILVMEALHLSVCKAVDEDVPKGVLKDYGVNSIVTSLKGAAYDSLWFRVIQAVHGDKIDSHSVRKVSIWSSILKEVQVLKSSGFDFLSYCTKRGFAFRVLPLLEIDFQLWRSFSE
ncbi:RNA-directed DNA polymerase, eukaryota [Tanacetum coccineum]